MLDALLSVAGVASLLGLWRFLRSDDFGLFFVVGVVDALLLVLLHSVHLVVLAAVRALAVAGLDLVVIARVADLVLAIARVELLLHLFQLDIADVADIVSTLAIRVLLRRVVVVIQRLLAIGLFLLRVLLVLAARAVAFVVAGVLFASFVVVSVRVVVGVVAEGLRELLILGVRLVAHHAGVVVVGVALVVPAMML